MKNKVNSEKYTNIGKRVPKLDALEKVTGKAVYPQDLKLPGMLYSKILWSEHAHAEIIEIDTKEAAPDGRFRPGIRRDSMTGGR